MKKEIKNLLTGKDNETHDLGRWSWLVSMVAVIAGFTWELFHNISVDFVKFSQAVATVVGAHAGALWVKKDTEPSQPKAANDPSNHIQPVAGATTSGQYPPKSDN